MNLSMEEVNELMNDRERSDKRNVRFTIIMNLLPQITVTEVNELLDMTRKIEEFIYAE